MSERNRNSPNLDSQVVYWLTPRALEVDEDYEGYRKRMIESGNPKNVGKRKPANLTMQTKMSDDTSKKKLNPDWVEQLMGLPVGHTQLSGAKRSDENRIDRLRLLGNGVVPQTAEKAFVTLAARAGLIELDE